MKGDLINLTLQIRYRTQTREEMEGYKLALLSLENFNSLWVINTFKAL